MKAKGYKGRGTEWDYRGVVILRPGDYVSGSVYLTIRQAERFALSLCRAIKKAKSGKPIRGQEAES